MARISICIVFLQNTYLQKLLLNSMCVRINKSKTINILDVKLVKNSDIIKLEIFNTSESSILTTKYVR